MFPKGTDPSTNETSLDLVNTFLKQLKKLIMKKLIYFPFALFIILMAASCSKDVSVKPIKAASLPNSATVSMINTSGSAYQVAFLGDDQYTVDMPASGRLQVTVKAGNYNIQVYPTGAYAPHTITWSGLAPVISARASFDNVLIKSADQPELLIY
jgi:hypothetical protein